MTLSKYEAWVQTAKSGESITYYDKGYLARQRFYDNNHNEGSLTALI